MNKILPRLIGKLTKTRFPISFNSQQVLHIACNYKISEFWLTDASFFASSRNQRGVT